MTIDTGEHLINTYSTMSLDTLSRSEGAPVAATAKLPYELWVRAKKIFIERPSLSLQQLLVEGLELRLKQLEKKGRD